MVDQELDVATATRVIAEFLRANGARWGIQDLHVYRAYGIDNRKLRPWLRQGGPRYRGAREKFLRFARDILESPDQTLGRLRGQPHGTGPGQNADPETLMRAANLLANSEDASGALASARLAFVTAARTSLGDALEFLPGVLYLTHRHGSPDQLCSTIRDTLLPAITSRRGVRGPPLILGAALGQLACALNEGGVHADAAAIFAERQVRAVAAGKGSLAWCGPALARNEAHCWAWHQGLFRLAEDCAENALQRDPSPANLHSVANTRCEIALAAADFRRAWEAIEPQYQALRGHLVTHYDLRTARCTGEPLPRFHHACESLYFGLVSRLRLFGPAYERTELPQDLLLLESMLLIDAEGRPRRSIQMGRRAAVPTPNLHPELRSRVDRLSRYTAKPMLSPVQQDAILELVKILAGGL